MFNQGVRSEARSEESFFFILFLIPGTLLSGGERSSGLDSVLKNKGITGKKLRLAVATMTWQKIIDGSFSWKVKQTASSVPRRMTRFSSDSESVREGEQLIWWHDFSFLEATSAAIKRGDKAEKEFVWEKLKAAWHYKSKSTQIDQVITGGPISLVLDKKGEYAPSFFEVWPEFIVKTTISRSSKGKKRKVTQIRDTLQINPALILPVAVLSQDTTLAALAKKSSFCYNQ